MSTDEWKGKKVVIFSVPGAFTPTCHVNHLPPYIQKYDEFKSKGVDVIAVVAANDVFVMSGWGRVEGLKDKVRVTTLTVVSRFSNAVNIRSWPYPMAAQNGPNPLDSALIFRTSVSECAQRDTRLSLMTLLSSTSG